MIMVPYQCAFRSDVQEKRTRVTRIVSYSVLDILCELTFAKKLENIFFGSRELMIVQMRIRCRTICAVYNGEMRLLTLKMHPMHHIEHISSISFVYSGTMHKGMYAWFVRTIST